VNALGRMVPTPRSGVPLAHYRRLRARVLLTCLDCHYNRSLGLEAVIRRLETCGHAGEHTGIKAVASFATLPCPRCGGRRFETRPDFPRMQGQ
jgi:hypothetical protein